MWLGNGIAPSAPASEAAAPEVVEVTSDVAHDAPPSLVAVVAEAAADEPLASPIPPAPPSETPVEINGEEIIMRCGDRRYRVRGLAKNLSFDQMKVNVLASRGDSFHVDTLEMYAARQRALFIKQAAEEMAVKEDVVKRDLGRLLLKLEELQEEQIKRALEPKEQVVAISDEDRDAALTLLRDPQLLGAHPRRL